MPALFLIDLPSLVVIAGGAVEVGGSNRAGAGGSDYDRPTSSGSSSALSSRGPKSKEDDSSNDKSS